MAAVLENLSTVPDQDLEEAATSRPAGRVRAVAPPAGPGRAVVRDWVWVLAPTLMLGLVILLLFRNPFLYALTSMPGSQIVQAIVVAFAGGLGLVCAALHRFGTESALLAQWRHAASVEARERLLDGWGRPSWVLSLLRALGARETSVFERQVRLDAELSALRERLAGRLTAPNYLAGSLIGLGLVGTFLGLIATLGDLGRLFDSLLGADRAGMNPTDMFADMVRRLQEPMQGMGTAFVSSLFGLVASLLLGLNALTVARAGSRVADDAAELVRQFEAERSTAQAAELESVAAQQRETLALEMKLRAEEWRRFLDDLVELQARQEHQASLWREQIAEMSENTRTLANALRDRLRVDRAPARLRLREDKSAPRRRATHGLESASGTGLDDTALWKNIGELTAAQGEKLAAELGRISQEQTGLMWNMSQNLEHLSELLHSTLSRQLSLTLTVDPSRKPSS
jgi:hypothetical protein